MYLAFFLVYRNHTNERTTRLKVVVLMWECCFLLLSFNISSTPHKITLSTLSTPLMLSSPEFAFYNYRRALKRR